MLCFLVSQRRKQVAVDGRCSRALVFCLSCGKADLAGFEIDLGPFELPKFARAHAKVVPGNCES